jgi:hypothetical protein
MSWTTDVCLAERYASVTIGAERHAGVALGCKAMKEGGAR